MKQKTLQKSKLRNTKWLKQKYLKNMIIYMKINQIQKVIKTFMFKMMLWRCRGEKKKKIKIDGFRKKLMIPESEISECPEYEVRSKIGRIFVNIKKTSW